MASLREDLRNSGILANKSFGQHFLLDDNVCHNIAALAGNISDNHIIEIGPGPGGLTRQILAMKPKSLNVVERDKRFDVLLSPLQQASSVMNIIYEDALKVNVNDIVATNDKIIMSNLPYNIGTVLYIDWLKKITNIKKMVLMFQKEVALRITAKVGDNHYGRLAVMSEIFANARLAMHVKAAQFTPPPKVDSAVIVVEPKMEPLSNLDFKFIEAVIAKAFNQRRKMLKKIFKNDAIDWQSLDIDATQRPEELFAEQFVQIAEYLYKETHKKDEK